MELDEVGLFLLRLSVANRYWLGGLSGLEGGSWFWLTSILLCFWLTDFFCFDSKYHSTAGILGHWCPVYVCVLVFVLSGSWSGILCPLLLSLPSDSPNPRAIHPVAQVPLVAGFKQCLDCWFRASDYIFPLVVLVLCICPSINYASSCCCALGVFHEALSHWNIFPGSEFLGFCRPGTVVAPGHFCVTGRWKKSFHCKLHPLPHKQQRHKQKGIH